LFFEVFRLDEVRVQFISVEVMVKDVQIFLVDACEQVSLGEETRSFGQALGMEVEFGGGSFYLLYFVSR
jgi:hypothetical protein